MPPGLSISSPARAISALGAVALLVLLARAAPAGVVPPDLLPLVLDHRLLLRNRSAAVPSLPLDRPLGGDVRTGGGRDRGLAQRRGLLGAAAGVVDLHGLAGGRELLLGPGSDLDFDVEDQPRELLPDRVHESLEHREALVLVGDQRVDLGEAAEVDALAQVVHLVEVLAPAVVDDLQQDRTLELTHDLIAELLLAAVVGGQGI